MLKNVNQNSSFDDISRASFSDIRDAKIDLHDTMDKLSGEYNARVAAIVQPPNPNRHCTFAKPSVEDALDAFGYEYTVTDPLERFLHYLQIATSSLNKLIPEELEELKELLDIVVEKSRSEQKKTSPP